MRTGCGCNERSVARPVRCLDLDVRFSHLLLRGEIGPGGRNHACCHCRHEIPSREFIVFHGPRPPPGEYYLSMSVPRFLHVTNGTSLTMSMEAARMPGLRSIWADPLYEGPVPAGLPDDELIKVRSRYLAG